MELPHRPDHPRHHAPRHPPPRPRLQIALFDADTRGRTCDDRARLADQVAYARLVLDDHDGDVDVDRTWIRLNRAGQGTTQVPFAADLVDRVEVTLVNTSTQMTGCGTDQTWTYSCAGYGQHDNQQHKVTVKAIG